MLKNKNNFEIISSFLTVRPRTFQGTGYNINMYRHVQLSSSELLLRRVHSQLTCVTVAEFFG